MRFYDLFSWDVGGKTLKIKLTLELSFINIPPFFSLFLQKWKVISTFLNK
jgi:hypothetical protein